MQRDILSVSDPGAAAGLDMIHEPFQPGDSARPSGQAQVEADRQHLRLALALGIKRVDRIDAAAGKIVRKGKFPARHERHVIGIEGIGHDDVRANADLAAVIGARQRSRTRMIRQYPARGS
ncbi:MAG: hypothetical protein WBG92_01850 [Thiohalocapsa sp.]